MKAPYTIILLLAVVFADISGQSGGGTIRGKVVDATTNEPIPFASVVIWNTTTGAMTDFDGNFPFHRPETRICGSEGLVCGIQALYFRRSDGNQQ